ncbi:hypothetical protein [Nocardia sp. NPDC057668]|uniref:hypothetical protein n=1 Tax=Nocardia sp. NPDC057668 TaxID=3346202 RepID=UPI00366BB639
MTMSYEPAEARATRQQSTDAAPDFTEFNAPATAANHADHSATTDLGESANLDRGFSVSDSSAEPPAPSVHTPAEPRISADSESLGSAADSESADHPGTASSDSDPESSSTPADPTPDIGFSLTPPEPEPEPDLAERARRLAHRIAQDLIAEAPTGWDTLTAAFAVTVAGQVSRVVFADTQQRQAQILPSPQALAMVEAHRGVAAQLGDPWWRLELVLTAAGELTVDHDYGDEPFPDDQLFAPQAYLADLEAYPRAELPTWLAAYLRHGNRQSRPPRDAAEMSRVDATTGARPIRSRDDFPDFPLLWARWAAIAAAFVAVGSERGPRVLPSFAWFEGSRRSGASLYQLPGGRAVLSGGVWNAPQLHAAYNGHSALPRLYDGAPEWVANPVLNTRAGAGLLSFCYWWDQDSWYRGESPAARELAAAVPGIWTADSAASVISGLLADDPTAEQRAAAVALVAAAEGGRVTRELLAEIFGAAADLDSANYQLLLAGVVE